MRMMMTMTRRCRVLSSHHRALVLLGGGRSRSITWRIAIWMDSKMREYLHSMIVAINNKQETSMMVECQAHRIVEHAISMALLLGADRELDSSITIKSIVSHLFLFNLSHTTTKR